MGNQSRKWQLTCNNPAEKGLSHEFIKDKLFQLEGMVYWCLCDEIGSQETYHIHVYFYTKTPRYFTTIQNLFSSEFFHIEPVRGSSAENRDYILKSGQKYNKQDDGTYNYQDKSGHFHSGINYSDTFEEYGVCPDDKAGVGKSDALILELIKSGCDNSQIVDAVPAALNKLEKINQVRSMYRDKTFSNSWRDLDVTYLYGTSGSGKSRSIIDKYGFENVYRVTDYKHPFDTYDGQDIIVFEEFRSQLALADMLNYLDGYPLLLPCRYFNRQACYTKVYIISNIALYEQYKNQAPENRAAFLRRIHHIIHVKSSVGVPFVTEMDKIPFEEVEEVQL